MLHKSKKIIIITTSEGFIWQFYYLAVLSIYIHATEALFRAEMLSCSGHLRRVCRKDWPVTYLILLPDIPREIEQKEPAASTSYSILIKRACDLSSVRFQFKKTTTESSSGL